MRVLLLSAYDAVSHRYWCDNLMLGLADWEWTRLSLPARHFNWRIRSNALTWSFEQRELLQCEYDLVLATSMVDLATLRGLVPELTAVPTVLYFHENQFAYPENQKQQGRLEAQMLSLYSALAADGLLFNSHYNLSTFLRGCESMLAAFPDQVPHGVVELLEQRSSVLPVPLAQHFDAMADDSEGESEERGELQILWNHRWEYDKAPDILLDIVLGLVDRGTAFRLHVAGEQFRQQPASFARIRDALQRAQALGQWGYVESVPDYHRLLLRCDVVLSTARHDFQGVSMLEACMAGCTPLAPRRLVYPEWFAPGFLYHGADQASEVRDAVHRLHALAEARNAGKSLPRADVSGFRLASLIPRYRAYLDGQSRDKSVL